MGAEDRIIGQRGCTLTKADLSVEEQGAGVVAAFFEGPMAVLHATYQQFGDVVTSAC